MVIENNPSARMQLRSMGELMHPASCCVCQNGTCEAGYIDLGVFYDWEGNLYLCKTCAYELGETFGMFTPAEVKHLQDQLNEALNALSSAKEELEHARPIISAFERTVTTITDAGSRIVSPAYEGVEQEQQLTDEPAEAAVSGESEIKEPALSTGRSDAGGSESHNFTFK